jgi:Xaa-Pro aminopeptidase
MRQEKLGAFLVTNPSNIFYLTGINNFDSEKGFLMVVDGKDYKLVSSLFYQNRIEGVVPKQNVVYAPRGQKISEYMAREIKNGKRIGFEREDLSYLRYEIYKKILRGKKLIPYSSAVENQRQIKSNGEIALIKKAAAITDKTFSAITKLIKPGITELFLKRKVLEIMQGLGALGCSFDPIIASSRGSADPHYEGANKKIKSGEMVIIDIGARYKNYCADMTRTIFVGKATPLFKNRYNLVLGVQEKALKDCTAKTGPLEVYNSAVERFKAVRQDQYFTHGLGHGVGINIHESPSLSASGAGKFENGMVFTVEPGIYYPSWGGIRIEDLCLMENGEVKTLSKSPKRLAEIV